MKLIRSSTSLQYNICSPLINSVNFKCDASDENLTYPTSHLTIPAYIVHIPISDEDLTYPTSHLTDQAYNVHIPTSDVCDVQYSYIIIILFFLINLSHLASYIKLRLNLTYVTWPDVIWRDLRHISHFPST